MKKHTHKTGARENILDPDELKDLKELSKIKKAKKSKHTDLTDDEIKRLVFMMAKSQNLI